MPNEQIKCNWAKIVQLRKLPKIPVTVCAETPTAFTEKIKRMEHKIKIAKAKQKYCHT